MAVAGLLVHARKEMVAAVAIAVAATDGMTCYGVHDDQFLVTVAEVPADRIDKTVETVKALDGVLTVYTTYLTIEDEMDEQGNIRTSIDVNRIFGKRTAPDIPIKP